MNPPEGQGGCPCKQSPDTGGTCAFSSWSSEAETHKAWVGAPAATDVACAPGGGLLGTCILKANPVSTQERAVRLWRRLGFDVFGTLPRALRHQRLGSSMPLSCTSNWESDLSTETAMHFRPAKPEEVRVVAGVLCAAAADLRDRDLELWSEAQVSELAVSPHVRDGLYHLGLNGPDAVGVFRLQLKDPIFWPEVPDGTSAYLHKLAVVPARKGEGIAHALLGHAAGLTRRMGLRFLRLDCMSGRPALSAVYQGFGFKHPSRKMLGGKAYERFELDVGAPAQANYAVRG